MKSKGESQRIYWQQWISPKQQQQQQQQQHNVQNSSRRELITSSAAIRISPDAAKAKDVTKLLRDTLNLSSFQKMDNPKTSNIDQDSLVLVGTLYSLPSDYVRFEHESSENNVRPSHHRGDPFHVVKTLAPEDNPLQTRDKMLDHLRELQHQAQQESSSSSPTGTTIRKGPTISPKVQWYFVPSSSSDSPIPNCIELDGYCSSMEDDALDSDDEGSVSNHHQQQHQIEHSKEESSSSSNSPADTFSSPSSSIFDDIDLIFARCPFLNNNDHDDSNIAQDTTGSTTTNLSTTDHPEVRRYNQLNQSIPSSVCISGYLLKRSNIDRHVWRRVYCVLTGDNLWYVSRLPYTYSSTSSRPTITATDDTLRIAKKHGRIALDRALLLEPNSGYRASPLYRIPNSFEVVSSRGTSHVFRAPNLSMQRQWLRALSTKILDSFENSLMAHAELIVADECIARNKRFSALAVQPIWDPTSLESKQLMPPITMSILRFGMETSEYKEQCRHIQAFLPAKQPVVVISSDLSSPRNHNKNRPTSPTANHNNHDRQTTRPMSPPATAEPLNDDMKQLVQAAWDKATIILARATHISAQFHNHHNSNNNDGNKNSNNDNQQTTTTPIKHKTRSLEILCRHVDYVITGQHRSLSSQGNFELNASSGKNTAGRNGSSDTGAASNRHDHDPPPMDLFDNILAELQSLVKSCGT